MDPKAKACALVGIRRIGRAAIIKEFIKDRRSIFFQFIKSSSKTNLLEISSTMSRFLSNDVEYNNHIEFFDDPSNIAKEERAIFVFDEYTYLAIRMEHSLQWSRISSTTTWSTPRRNG